MVRKKNHPYWPGMLKCHFQVVIGDTTSELLEKNAHVLNNISTNLEKKEKVRKTKTKLTKR